MGPWSSSPSVLRVSPGPTLPLFHSPLPPTITPSLPLGISRSSASRGCSESRTVERGDPLRPGAGPVPPRWQPREGYWTFSKERIQEQLSLPLALGDFLISLAAPLCPRPVWCVWGGTSCQRSAGSQIRAPLPPHPCPSHITGPSSLGSLFIRSDACAEGQALSPVLRTQRREKGANSLALALATLVFLVGAGQAGRRTVTR